jgi:hypothetical protein
LVTFFWASKRKSPAVRAESSACRIQQTNTN